MALTAICNYINGKIVFHLDRHFWGHSAYAAPSAPGVQAHGLQLVTYMKVLILAFLIGFQAFAVDVELNSSDYFKRLGLKSGASQQEIKSAFRALAKIYHPDVTGTGNVQAMQKLTEAYDNLSKGVTLSAQKPAAASPTGKSNLNEKELLVYNRMLANLRAKISTNQIDKMGFDPIEFPITAFYYAVVDISDWILNGEDLSDSVDSIAKGLSPLSRLEKMAVEDFFDETVRENSPFNTRFDVDVLLKQSRIDLLMNMLSKNYPGGEDFLLIKDLVFSLKKVTAGNQMQIAAAFNYLSRIKAGAHVNSEKLDYLGRSISELLVFYNQLDNSEGCSEYLR